MSLLFECYYFKCHYFYKFSLQKNSFFHVFSHILIGGNNCQLSGVNYLGAEDMSLISRDLFLHGSVISCHSSLDILLNTAES